MLLLAALPHITCCHLRLPVAGDELLGLAHCTRLTRLSAAAMTPELDNKQAALLAKLTSLQHLVSRHTSAVMTVCCDATCVLFATAAASCVCTAAAPRLLPADTCSRLLLFYRQSLMPWHPPPLHTHPRTLAHTYLTGCSLQRHWCTWRPSPRQGADCPHLSGPHQLPHWAARQQAAGHHPRKGRQQRTRGAGQPLLVNE